MMFSLGAAAILRGQWGVSGFFTDPDQPRIAAIADWCAAGGIDFVIVVLAWSLSSCLYHHRRNQLVEYGNETSMHTRCGRAGFVDFGKRCAFAHLLLRSKRT